MAAQTVRPTLDAWLREYDAIEQEWMDALRAHGIVFAPRNSDADALRQVRSRLAEKGARFMNGGASVSTGPLSSACVACTGDCGSRTFFLSLACNRDCYFCFNKNQDGFDQQQRLKADWEGEVDDFLEAPAKPTHAALTGGEPLLHRTEALRFFEKIHAAGSEIHLRLYTAGDFLDDATAQALAEAGLREMRLSVKLGDGDDAAAIDEALATLERAQAHIPDVMVEMPVIPGTEASMRTLLERMDEMGLFGINLLEFCFPYANWGEYARRGFKVKNPAFEVLYDYGYAGGLPIAGSELACLELVEFALDAGLSMGVHYCSLDNKNRDQILQMNRILPTEGTVYQLDAGDRFLKTVKVFDQDVPLARARLDEHGKHYVTDAEDGSLSTRPDNLRLLEGLAVAVSINIVEPRGGEQYVRELKLSLC